MARVSIEKQWIEFTYPCVITVNQELGFRCGYVGVPVGHILHSVGYDGIKYPTKNEILKTGWSNKVKIFAIANPDYGLDVGRLIKVHGGLTFNGPIGLDLENPDYWRQHWFFGYDCGHHGDKLDISLLSKDLPEEARAFMVKRYRTDRGTIRTLRYCIEQCKNLARQLHFLMNGEIRQELLTKETKWYETLEP
jgi:hypothetical protein